MWISEQKTANNTNSSGNVTTSCTVHLKRRKKNKKHSLFHLHKNTVSVIFWFSLTGRGGKKKICGNTAIAGLDLRAVKMKNWSTTFLAPVSNRWRKKGGVIGSPPSRDSPSHSALQRLRGPVRAAISASVHLLLFPLKAIPGTLP